MDETQNPEEMIVSMRYAFIADMLTQDAHKTGELPYNQIITIEDTIGFNSEMGMIDFKIRINEERLN